MKKETIAVSLLAAAVMSMGVLAGCGSEPLPESGSDETIVSTLVTENGRKEEALASAKAHITKESLSYEETVQTLGGEEYTKDEAVYGASYCGADWDAQAVRRAEKYLTEDPEMTADELEKKLEAVGFSEEEVQYGLEENRLLIRMEIA